MTFGTGILLDSDDRIVVRHLNGDFKFPTGSTAAGDWGRQWRELAQAHGYEQMGGKTLCDKASLGWLTCFRILKVFHKDFLRYNSHLPQNRLLGHLDPLGSLPSYHRNNSGFKRKLWQRIVPLPFHIAQNSTHVIHKSHLCVPLALSFHLKVCQRYKSTWNSVGGESQCGVWVCACACISVSQLYSGMPQLPPEGMPPYLQECLQEEKHDQTIPSWKSWSPLEIGRKRCVGTK